MHDVQPSELAAWHARGFTTAQAAVWSRWPLDQATRVRDEDLNPYRALDLPPGPRPPIKGRGLHWYAQWQLAKRGLGAALHTCAYCGARDQQNPCRTCRAEGRGAPLNREWSSYCRFAAVDPAYADDHVGDRVLCGDRKCQTPLPLSAAGEGVRL